MSSEIITSKAIGAIIRKQRKELGFSQEQLAEKVGVSYQQIQRYENGDSMLNVENVQRLATALSLPLTALCNLGNSGVPTKSTNPCFSSEEKTLLKTFRAIRINSDRKLAISILKRIAKP